MSVELKLSRSNKIYCPNEPINGKIIINLSSSISHSTILLKVNASVNLQVRGGSAGIIESIYGVIKPIPILNKTIEVRSSGKMGAGITEIPFSVILKRPGDENLEKIYETFHGADISIQYLLTVDIPRGYLHKSLSATLEFIIQSVPANLPEQPLSPEMVIFYITQDTQRHSLLPKLKSGGFRITGKVCTQCSLTEPISGELTVEASIVPICSIDIHLLRVESILVGERIITETSVIQTTQIADGDVCRNLTLPIYLMLPRLLTCATIYAGNSEKHKPVNITHRVRFLYPSPFSIEFKLTIVVTFETELSKLHPKYDPKTPRPWLAMESVPLELVRTRCDRV